MKKIINLFTLCFLLLTQSTFAANSFISRGASSGSGDTSTNTATSVVGEIALFADTTGKVLKRATGSGLAKITSGVLSAAAAGTDYVAATSGSAIQKADGAGGLTAASAGTDYVGVTSGSAVQKANGSGGLTAATAGTDYLSPTGTETMSNKTITRRVVAASDATSVTPNTDSADMTTQANTQSVGTLTINADGGTPVSGRAWIFRIKSTNVQTYSWNAQYRGSTDTALPTTSTGGSKTDYIGFIYNSADSKYDCVAVSAGY